MLNYVPKEKTPVSYEGIKLEDPKLQKEFKKMKIKELKYNRFQIKELNHVNRSDSRANGNVTTGSGVGTQFLPPDPSPDMSPLHLHQGFDNDIKEIKRYIKTLLYKQKHAEQLDKIRSEWRAVALVLDRLFFFLYVISIVVSLAAIFPKTGA